MAPPELWTQIFAASVPHLQLSTLYRLRCVSRKFCSLVHDFLHHQTVLDCDQLGLTLATSTVLFKSLHSLKVIKLPASGDISLLCTCLSLLASTHNDLDLVDLSSSKWLPLCSDFLLALVRPSWKLILPDHVGFSSRTLFNLHADKVFNFDVLHLFHDSSDYSSLPSMFPNLKNLHFVGSNVPFFALEDLLTMLKSHDIHLTSLTGIDASWQQLMETCPTLESLSIAPNTVNLALVTQLSSSSVVHLHGSPVPVSFIKQLPALRTVSFCNLKPLEIPCFVPLHLVSSLHCLTLDCNNFGEWGAVLSQVTNLYRLSLLYITLDRLLPLTSYFPSKLTHLVVKLMSFPTDQRDNYGFFNCLLGNDLPICNLQSLEFSSVSSFPRYILGKKEIDALLTVCSHLSTVKLSHVSFPEATKKLSFSSLFRRKSVIKTIKRSNLEIFHLFDCDNIDNSVIQLISRSSNLRSLHIYGRCSAASCSLVRQSLEKLAEGHNLSSEPTLSIIPFPRNRVHVFTVVYFIAVTSFFVVGRFA
ncbi:hypothetical protein RCL1_009120 [Eukaryota sp. TZLM3-RCL]